MVAVDWCLPQTQFLQQLEESQQLQYQEGEDEDEKDEAPAEYSPSEHPEPPKVSRDIEEGQTIFVRNVPFTASEEALKKVYEFHFCSVVLFSLILSYSMCSHGLVWLSRMTHIENSGFQSMVK